MVSDRYSTPVYSAMGFCFVFLQALICSMVLSDTRSLFLGSWDLTALGLFILLTFVAVPILVSIVFIGCYRISSKFFLLGFFLLIAIMLAREIDFFVFRRLFVEQLFIRIGLLAIIATGIFLILHQYQESVISFFKITPILSLVLIGYFSVATGHPFVFSSSTKTTDATAASMPSKAKPHVFVISFERVLHDHLFTQGQNIDETQFPNFARIVATSNNYHNAYANSTFTWTGLQHLYTGTYFRKLDDILGQGVDRKQPSSFAEIFGRLGWRVVFVTDMATHLCDKKIHICLGASGDNSFRRRWKVVRAWYQEYLKLFLPTGLLAELGILPTWDVILWEDIVDTEELRRARGMERPLAPNDLGIFQMEALIKAIGDNVNLPTIFISHNLAHHSFAIKTSALAGPRDPTQYQIELEKSRQSLEILDKLLGQFLASLDQHNLYDKSMIVLTSDTGDDPDESLFIKGQSEIVDTPELARIFLAIKFPHQTNRLDFQVPVSQVDVLPTVVKGFKLDANISNKDGIPALDPKTFPSLQNHPIFLLPQTNDIYRLVKPLSKWIKVN